MVYMTVPGMMTRHSLLAYETNPTSHLQISYTERGENIGIFTAEKC